MSDYQRIIEVKASPSGAYAAVTSGFGAWWTAAQAPLARIGDVATFSFPPATSSWTFRPNRLEPDRLVEHECVAADHSHEGLPESIRTEWLGTLLRFQIEPLVDGGSRVTFTHQGQTPKLECFDVCEAGWDFFFAQSLKKYLDTGKGEPHQAG